jgi:hypothetical protein
MQLPELNGSEKQIKWASDIRKEAIAWSEANITKLRKQGLSEGYLGEIRKAFCQVIIDPKRLQSRYWIDNRKAHWSEEAPYETEITEAMKSILEPVREQFKREEPVAAKKGSVRRHLTESEVDEIIEMHRAEAEDEPKKLCWSVPIPGCSVHRFIEVWIGEGEFCVMINSQFSSYPLNAIQPCEVPGRPEIVAKIGRVGLTAERRDALLQMAKEAK